MRRECGGDAADIMAASGLARWCFWIGVLGEVCSNCPRAASSASLPIPINAPTVGLDEYAHHCGAPLITRRATFASVAAAPGGCWSAHAVCAWCRNGGEDAVGANDGKLPVSASPMSKLRLTSAPTLLLCETEAHFLILVMTGDVAVERTGAMPHWAKKPGGRGVSNGLNGEEEECASCCDLTGDWCLSGLTLEGGGVEQWIIVGVVGSIPCGWEVGREPPTSRSEIPLSRLIL
jgi:hypothetical protein